MNVLKGDGPTAQRIFSRLVAPITWPPRHNRQMPGGPYRRWSCPRKTKNETPHGKMLSPWGAPNPPLNQCAPKTRPPPRPPPPPQAPVWWIRHHTGTVRATQPYTVPRAPTNNPSFFFFFYFRVVAAERSGRMDGPRDTSPGAPGQVSTGPTKQAHQLNTCPPLLIF